MCGGEITNCGARRSSERGRSAELWKHFIWETEIGTLQGLELQRFHIVIRGFREKRRGGVVLEDCEDRCHAHPQKTHPQSHVDNVD